MSLTIAQRSTIRRHLYFPVVGLMTLNPAGGSFYNTSVGFRWMQSYAFLEWRMDTLNPDEEARITGYAYGAVLAQGFTKPGDVISVTLSGGPLTSPVVITYTAGAQDNTLTMVAALAALSNQNSTLQAAGFYAVAPYGTGPYNYQPAQFPLTEVAWLNPSPFSITVTSSGSTGAAITAGGEQLHPRAVITDPLTNQRTAYWGYVNILNALETAVATASDDLDTFKADVWTARPDEVAQREGLYLRWRERLSRFIDIPLWENTIEGVATSGQGLGSYAAIGQL